VYPKDKASRNADSLRLRGNRPVQTGSRVRARPWGGGSFKVRGREHEKKWLQKRRLSGERGRPHHEIDVESR